MGGGGGGGGGQKASPGEGDGGGGFSRDSQETQGTQERDPFDSDSFTLNRGDPSESFTSSYEDDPMAHVLGDGVHRRHQAGGEAGGEARGREGRGPGNVAHRRLRSGSEGSMFAHSPSLRGSSFASSGSGASSLSRPSPSSGGVRKRRNGENEVGARRSHGTTSPSTNFPDFHKLSSSLNTGAGEDYAENNNDGDDHGNEGYKIYPSIECGMYDIQLLDT